MPRIKSNQPRNIYAHIPASIVTRDVIRFVEPTGNIYESLNVISRRARQISSSMKEELSERLSEFASTVDNLEEIHENREQIEISRFYERLPKPTQISLDEFIEGKVYFRRNEEEALIGTGKE
jgi:DNA-directed RNA polymerase subunit K/omega